jgi:hypothetical protein
MLLDEDLLPPQQDVEPDERPYVTMAAWRDHAGRDDLVDCVADEFERRPAVRDARIWSANYR